jgi:PAS domain S-box-containing protein
MGAEDLRTGACPSRRETVRDVLAFIEQHYHERLLLQDVAQAVSFTASYLTDLLRRETGLSIHRWIIEHRLAEAKRLLVSSEMPVGAIAEQVGFSDASHFCRQFVKRTGFTPRRWRQAKRPYLAPQAQREMLQSFLDAIPQLVWAKDVNGNLFYANEQWHAYTGQTPAQSAGWGWLDAVYPSDVNRCLARWSAALAAGTPLEYYVRLRRAADSQYRWHLVRTTLHRGSDDVARWIGTGTDVHDDLAESIAAGARDAA